MKKYQYHWLFCLLVISVIFGTIYKVSRVNLDVAAYSPLAAKAVDRAWRSALYAERNDGQVQDSLDDQVNAESSLSSFFNIYDSDKKLVDSTGVIDGQPVDLPESFLDNTAPEVRNYFIWEPKPGVRLAGVSVSMGEYGFVLAAQSAQEFDRQASRLTRTVIIAWLVSVVLMTVGFLVISHKRR